MSYPQCSEFLCKQVREALEAALKCTQPGGACVQPGPHPGHIHLVREGLSEFAFQHRLPHLFINGLPGPFSQPGFHRGGFE